MSLKFILLQNKNDATVKAVFTSRERDEDSVCEFVQVGEVVLTGGAASTLTALIAMPNAQGESFRETMEDLVTEAYRQGQKDVKGSGHNLQWPKGHD